MAERTCCRLAEFLDREMLARQGVPIYPWTMGWDKMPPLDAAAITAQLGGRSLLSFVPNAQAGTLLEGTTRVKWVTPTPYPPTEAMIEALALPTPTLIRDLVLLLNPRRLVDVRGPRNVKGGTGIEYALPQGFPADAIVEMSSDPSDRPARWELRVS